MRVLLIGNYPHDAQESMQRFARMMSEGLRAAGVSVELLIPPPGFGWLKKSGHGIGKWLGYLDKFLVFPILLRRRISERRNDSIEVSSPLVVHICDHSNAFYTRFLRDVPHVITCHDLLAVRSARGEVLGNPTRWSGRRLQDLVMRGLTAAQRIVCVSEATQRDLFRLIAPARDRVAVISLGLHHPYSPMPDSEAYARVTPLFRDAAEAATPELGVASPRTGFILHVGGNQWYKNRLGVLRIYALASAEMKTTPNLVMVGKPFTAEMKEFVAANNLETRVLRIEGCDDEDLRALYSQADLLLFPSLAEGFGWPVIEAQACGCPVLCSSIEPFPEVTRGTASMHDPADEAGYAAELLRLFSHSEARRRLSRQGLANARRFAPATMIASYLAYYDQLLTPTHAVPP